MKYAGALTSALQAIGAESRWCVWRMTAEGKKTPINPRTGGGAMANEPSTWADFDTAYESRFIAKKIECDGFGFFLGGGYAGIDIDDCIDDSGNISDMAAKIIEKMNSYTEKSPRGHGIHILCRVSEGFTLDGKQGARNDKIGLEMYLGGRYLTVTGHKLGAEKPIEFRENELLEVYREYFVIPRENGAKKQPVNVSQGRNDLRVAGDKSDNELWDFMFTCENGAKIHRLYSGDTSDYANDESRADLGLCSLLAYYTGHDAGRIDRMFRQSGLMRAKWDEMRGTQTYGAMTIARAIQTSYDYGTSKPASTPKKTGGTDRKYDPSAYHPDDDYEDSGHDEESAQSIKPINPPENRLQNETPSQVENDNSGHDDGHSENETHTVLDYLRNSFLSDIDRAKLFSKRKTGYSNIDKYNSLLPGLYVIGAVTGVGKTTFCGQMADYLAGAGEHVLYFALEQTELELVSKGLARLTAQEVIKTYGADALTKYTHTDAMTAIDIRKGVKTIALQQAIEAYQKFGGNLRIVECDFNTNAQTIIQTVYDFMKKHRVRPVVFVDYLQLVRNPNQRLSTKDAVDDNVRAFKKLSTECDLAVFLISSLNRENYLNVVDMTAFKETGSIEYTADVVYGMQLLVMNAGIFNTDSRLQIKRKFVNEAKNETPRKIEIIGLKNRYGRSYSRYFFDYYPAYDLFVPYERREGDKRTEEEFIADIDAEMSAKYQAFAIEHADELDSGRGGKKKPPKV